MVRWTRSGRITPGKEAQAISWAKEFLDWHRKKYNSQPSVYMDCFGEVGTLRWFEDFENLAALRNEDATEYGRRRIPSKGQPGPCLVSR